MTVRNELKHDVSPPLSDLVKAAPPPESGPPREVEELRLLPLPSGFKPAGEPDPVLQGAPAASPGSLGPTVIKNVAGIGQDVPVGFSPCCVPPDTNGAVGLTQYVQWVNIQFAVFDKTTGAMLPNFPADGNTLWKGFGGPCETHNDGDPIVLYDKLADRWVFSQLVIFGPAPGFFQCVAVSTSPDATGTYNRYAFSYSTFDDYPKMSVWPDAYYETFNMFDSNGNFFLGAEACAYDRTAMLSGLAATQICFPKTLDATVGGLLPSDVAPPSLGPQLSR